MNPTTTTPTVYDTILALVAFLASQRHWNIQSVQATAEPEKPRHVRATTGRRIRLALFQGADGLRVNLHMDTHVTGEGGYPHSEMASSITAEVRPGEVGTAELWGRLLRKLVSRLSADTATHNDELAELWRLALPSAPADDEDVQDPDSGPLGTDLPPIVSEPTKGLARGLEQPKPAPPLSTARMEGMREGQDWAAAAIVAAVDGKPWDTEGATPSLRSVLRTLPVVMAREVSEALRPLALALGWTADDEVSGSDIQNRIEWWAEERKALARTLGCLPANLQAAAVAWKEEREAREPLRLLAEAIGRGKGHTTTAIDGAKLEAATGRPVTLVCGASIGAARHRGRTLGVQTRSVFSIQRGEVFAGPVVIDPDTIQELARRICPDVRLGRHPPVAEAALSPAPPPEPSATEESGTTTD